LVDDDVARPVGEDRRQNRPPRSVDHIPDSGGDGAARSAPEHPGRDRGPAAVAGGTLLPPAQAQPTCLSAGDVRPNAGIPTQNPARSAINGQPARFQSGSGQFCRCRTPEAEIRRPRERRIDRSSGEPRLNTSSTAARAREVRGLHFSTRAQNLYVPMSKRLRCLRENTSVWRYWN